MAQDPRFGRGAGPVPFGGKKVPAQKAGIFGSFRKHDQKLFHELFAVPMG